MTNRLRGLIDALAAFYGLPGMTYRGESYLPGEMLEAIVLTESSGNPNARRYEPHQDKAGRADSASDADRPGVDDAGAEDDASFGLMQLMGYNWRAIVGAPPKTTLRFELLYDAGFGLIGGIRILRDELAAVFRQHPTLTESERLNRALARYNGGPSGDDPDATGRMRRQVYVDHVGANCAVVRKDRKENA